MSDDDMLKDLKSDMHECSQVRWSTPAP
jgi:hypothetical protein